MPDEQGAASRQKSTDDASADLVVTGAGRGLHIAQAAVAAGHAVVATGRNPDRVTQAVGASENLLAVKLDVLVNNAANFKAGFFEETAPLDV
ncbi:hypothetical protein ACGIF2_05880 [Cellulomonas sp. P22]|uniref:hypothetical protein n=1 Tax=Cellulomonas sp. P22 TaxID=3373189 RepID=UPI00378A1AAB